MIKLKYLETEKLIIAKFRELEILLIKTLPFTERRDDAQKHINDALPLALMTLRENGHLYEHEEDETL